MPVILAAWEAEIERITVQFEANPGIKRNPTSKIINT
jgi:hypothetical protein